MCRRLSIERTNYNKKENKKSAGLCFSAFLLLHPLPTFGVRRGCNGQLVFQCVQWKFLVRFRSFRSMSSFYATYFQLWFLMLLYIVWPQLRVWGSFFLSIFLSRIYISFCLVLCRFCLYVLIINQVGLLPPFWLFFCFLFPLGSFLDSG